MALVFREIGSRIVWAAKSIDEDWLSDDDIRADALKYLKSDNNTLSIYLLENKALLGRIIGAHCAARDNVSNLDYALFDESLLHDIGIIQEATPAINVPDTEVTNWHRDLVKLTGKKVLRLADIIMSKGEVNRAQAVEVGKTINKLIDSKHIDKSKLNEKLLADLEKDKYKN